MYLAQGHNAVTPVRLEPATPQSQVKHSALPKNCFKCIRIYEVDIKNDIYLLLLSYVIWNIMVRSCFKYNLMNSLKQYFSFHKKILKDVIHILYTCSQFSIR